MKKIGVYIHIPFCKSKCPYCDFTSFDNIEEQQKSDYFDALSKEIKQNAELLSNYHIDSIFIGGGTPSFCDTNDIYQILSQLHLLKITPDAEITMEVNPKTVDFEKITEFQSMGINRISIGLQSYVNDELKNLGRIHTAKDFDSTYNDVVRAGFKNVNIDLMFRVPKQTVESFDYTLSSVKQFNPQHLSVYELTLYPHTDFFNRNDLNLPNEDEETLMYQHATAHLNDYNHYEISNYAKDGFECKHNLKYWNLEEYIGFGLSAHSFVNNARFSNVDNLEQYILNIDNQILPQKEVLSKDELLKEHILTALRTKNGLNYKVFHKKYHIDLFKKYQPIIEKYEKLGMLERKSNALKLTEKGFWFSNSIICEFI